MAGRLVRAYGELRQVELLLRSLAAALASPGCPPTAARAVDDPAFAAALRQVLPSLPISICCMCILDWFITADAAGVLG